MNRETEAADRFDLSAARRRVARLQGLVERVHEAVAGGADRGADTDLALIGIIRPLHRVLYSPSSPFHPDPGLDSSSLPGLSPLRILSSAAPDGSAYRFAEVSLVRERNRLLEALDESTDRAERFLAGQ